VTIAAAQEDFPTLVTRLQQEKPAFAKRHQARGTSGARHEVG
jgi:hypothetical protein